MPTVYQTFVPETAALPTSTFASPVKNNGTNFPVTGLAFDAAADEAAFWKFRALKYGSGNVTVEIDWYADTATSGVVRWGVAIGAITPDTDTTDIETKALATENTVDDTHLGTTGQRLHRAIVTVSNLDSLALDDNVHIRIRRIGSNGADTMTGDAILDQFTVTYSDT